MRNHELLVRDIKGMGKKEGLLVVLVRHALAFCKALMIIVLNP